MDFFRLPDLVGFCSNRPVILPSLLRLVADLNRYFATAHVVVSAPTSRTVEFHPKYLARLNLL
jgi:hypothetical protein